MNVLMIDDSEEGMERLAQRLGVGGFIPFIKRAVTAEEVLESLCTGAWDVVVAEYDLPRLSNGAILEIFQSSGVDIPFIFFLERISGQRAADTMERGAHDVVMKGEPFRLLPAIRRELRAARNRLEIRQIAQQLQQAQKMESIGRLASGIAHDFNNLLSPILGYTELLMMRESPGDSRYEKLEQIQSAAERARDLTRYLLAFSRQEIFEKAGVDLRKVTPANGAKPLGASG